MKVFAHRGLSSIYPENTIEAFKKALEYKIDGVETDVQLSKDGEMMIFHDELLNRTTNGTGFLKDYTKNELKKLNANNKKEGIYEIPTLDEFLSLFTNTDIIINLELKTSIFEYLGIERKVYDKIIEYGLKDRVIISSFNHYSLLRMKEIDKDIKTAVLTGDRIVNEIEYTKGLGCIAYHPFYAQCTPELIKKAHENDIDVNCWTVDDPNHFELVKAVGVDTIMTNCCDKYCEKK